MATLIFNLIFVFVTLSSVAFGFNDTTKQKYKYEICVYQQPKEKPEILGSRRERNFDSSTLISIRGTIFDYEKKPLSSATIQLINTKNKSEYGTVTDDNGNYYLQLPANEYKLSASYLGYTTLTIEKFKLISGEFIELNLKLGSSGAFKTFLIKSDKPLSKRRIRKIEQRLVNE